jgi:hypothetical protein
MKRTASVLAIAELIAVSMIVLIGGVASIEELARDGWITGGDTAWMLTYLTITTLGAGFVFIVRWNGRPFTTTTGLIIVAASPTTCAFICNAVLRVIAVAEVAIAIMHKRRRTNL